ncbi:hypothetical protein IV73_GL001065 [Weissella kandleri]|uniref:Uncharacterized protein n=1 Tax=Weissella kandleri TaxID=1616 RepID=A0A0R2JL61_9LACO|nr:hypothetical protein [Weissella kandleri]KRN74788.1 hypothetical protein IV73_GL001065 [Weissella kandleri]
MENQVGYFTVTVQKKGLYSMQFVTSSDHKNYIFVIDAQSYLEFFPAGDPILNDEYEITMNQKKDSRTGYELLSVVLRTQDYVFSDDVSEYEALELNDELGDKNMDLIKAGKMRQQRLDAIKNDNELMNDLNRLRQDEENRVKESIDNSVKQGAEMYLGRTEINTIEETPEKENEPSREITLPTQVGTVKSDTSVLDAFKDEYDEDFPM